MSLAIRWYVWVVSCCAALFCVFVSRMNSDRWSVLVTEQLEGEVPQGEEEEGAGQRQEEEEEGVGQVEGALRVE